MPEKHAQATGVDEVELRQIDHDRRRVAGLGTRQLIVEHRGRDQVELAFDSQDQLAIAPLRPLDDEGAHH